MTKRDFYKFHKAMTTRMHEIMLAKNQDYTNGVGDTDPFANFRQVEKFGVTTAEIGFLTRMSDKFARIASFAKGGELLVKDESVTDTALDLANYCILFLGFLAEKKGYTAPKAKRKRIRAKVGTVTRGKPMPATNEPPSLDARI